MFLSTVPAVWWSVGDLSSPGFSPQELDYVVQPPDWSPTVVRLIGIASTAVWLAAAGALAWAVFRRHVDRGWIFVMGPLVVVAAMVGYFGRVFTAGVIGANIGAGIGIIVGLPLALLLLVWALTQSFRIDHRRRRGPAATSPASR